MRSRGPGRLLTAACCLLSACAAGQAEEARAPETTAALFAFAPKETEVALAVRDGDLLFRRGLAALEALSGASPLKKLLEDAASWGEDKVGKSPLDETFFTSLKLSPELGAAIFLVDRGGRRAALAVVGAREPEQLIAAARYHAKKLLGGEISIEKRASDGPPLYDISGPKLPNMIASFRDGYLLLSDQEDLVKNAALQNESPVWAQLTQRSPLAAESHDALLYVSLDGKVGEALRRDYGALALGGEFVKSWQALTATARIEGDAIKARAFLTTPAARDLKPYFERNGGRGDLLSLASQETVSVFRATFHPPRVWQRLSELPSAAENSPTRLAEAFQGATGVRFSDPEDGILENLTGEVAYVSGPRLADLALLVGVNKPEPFDKALAALWGAMKVGLVGYRAEAERLRVELSPSEREEGGRQVFRLEVRQKDIPIPLIFEAGTTSDAVVLSFGEGWLDRAGARAGKSATSYYKRLYHPESRALLTAGPQAVLYMQFLDPAEGLESTPGEVAQTAAAYFKDPRLGEALSLARAALDRLYDATAAFFVRDDGLELVLRVTTM